MLHKDHVDKIEKQSGSDIAKEIEKSVTDLEVIIAKAQAFIDRLDSEVLGSQTKVEADVVTKLRHDLYTFMNDDTDIEILKKCVIQREPKFKLDAKVKTKYDQIYKKGKITAVLTDFK